MRLTVLGSGQDGALPQAAGTHLLHDAAREGSIPEVAASDTTRLFTTRSMYSFLASNAPWSALIDDGRLVASSESVWAGHEIELIPGPHRGEFTDTVAVSIGRRALWLPDVDSWEFAGVDTRVVLTHLNHTNPLCDPSSAENRVVHEAGFEVAFDGMMIEL